MDFKVRRGLLLGQERQRVGCGITGNRSVARNRDLRIGVSRACAPQAVGPRGYHRVAEIGASDGF